VDWVHAPDTSGFITFKGFADHASTASVAVTDAVGYDMESGILEGFAGLWAMPEYERYVEANFGPAGEYLMSCRKCKLVKPFLKLACDCRGLPVADHDGKAGHDGKWGITELDRPHDCARAGFDVANRDGKLVCTGTAIQVKHALNRLQSDSTQTDLLQHEEAWKQERKAHSGPPRALGGGATGGPVQGGLDASDPVLEVPLGGEHAMSKGAEEDLDVREKKEAAPPPAAKEVIFNIPKRLIPKHRIKAKQNHAAVIQQARQAVIEGGGEDPNQTAEPNGGGGGQLRAELSIADGAAVQSLGEDPPALAVATAGGDDSPGPMLGDDEAAAAVR